MIVKVLPHRMLDIYTYTMVMSLHMCPSHVLILYGLPLPLLSCMKVVSKKQDCRHLVTWYRRRCICSRYCGTIHDRGCAHSSRRSRATEMKCAGPYLHGRRILHGSVIRSPTDGRAIHTRHMYLCTQIFPRHRLCFTVVASPKTFHWLRSCQNIRSHFFHIVKQIYAKLHFL